jgi:hypothetical protein
VKRLAGLFLLLAGTWLAARLAVAWVVAGRAPAPRPLALHAVAVPLVQVALLEAVRRRRERTKAAT